MIILDVNNTIFLPLRLVTDEEFAAIKMRGITNALPADLLDNGGFPNRELRFWPVPSSARQAVELWLWEPLQIYGLDDELNLPPGYERYLTYALAYELCPAFGKNPTPELISSMMEAEDAIKTLNAVDFVSEPSDAIIAMTAPGTAYNYLDFIVGACMLPRKVT